MEKTKRQKSQEKAKKMLRDYKKLSEKIKNKSEVYRILANKFDYKDGNVVYQLIRRMKQNENY